MLGIAIPITTNSFIPRQDGKYDVQFEASEVYTWLTSNDVGAVRCYRQDGANIRQVLFYHEIDSDGNLNFIFDEVFNGKIVLSADA